MAIFETKSLDDFTNLQLTKWKSYVSNINTNTDSMVYLDASVISEVAFLLQQDLITQTNNSFIAYASGDELSNLGLDRGIPRNESTYSKGVVTFSRISIANQDYNIPRGTIVSTIENTEGNVLSYETIEDKVLYGKILKPTNITSVLENLGTITDGTYNYSISAISLDGKETDISNHSVVIANGNSTNSIKLLWDIVPGASAYNIYIGGLLLGQSTINTFIDTSTNTSNTQIAPTTNTTGNLSIDIDIISKNSGSIYNVGPFSITQMIEKPFGIEKVNNLNIITGGSNTEDDETYRARLKISLSNNSGKTTVKGYEATVLSVEGVETALVIHKDTDAINKITIYITSSDENNPIATQILIDKVSEVVNSDDNRAVCDEIVVEPTTLLITNIEVTILDYDSTTFTQTQLTASIQENLNKYLRSLSSNVLKVIDINNVIHDTIGVLDFTLINPTINITTNINETLSLGNLTINY